MERDHKLVLTTDCGVWGHPQYETHYHVVPLKFCPHGKWIKMACHACDFG